MKPLFELFAHEDDYPDLDAAGAVERLAQAVSCWYSPYR